MPGSRPPAGPFVCQLRVVLRGVSPLIWRRLLVRSDSTIADLHASLQLVFGWSDEHLNRFVFHGGEYGVWHDGGIASVTIPDTCAWPNLACAPASASCTSTTSLTAGSTTCASSRSCRSTRGKTIRSASAASVRYRPEDCGGPRVPGTASTIRRPI